MPFKVNPEQTEQTRKALLEASFALFARKSIETVTMEEAAKAAGFGVASMYRYYSTKPKLVIAVATFAFKRLSEQYIRRVYDGAVEGMNAAQVLDYFLESFIEMYLHHKELLRFNQFFNIYMQTEGIDDETAAPFRDMIGNIANRFHVVYVKAAVDHTVRTDVPERIMFSTTLHLMLAAATRYAVGLVYRNESDADATEELKTLKRARMREYIVQ